MMNDFFLFYEENIYVIYIIHILISMLLALFISFYILRRYIKKSKTIDARDKERLEEVALNGIVFRMLFKVSLHKNNQITIFFFMFFFNITVPFVGYFFTVWIAWYLMNVKYEIKTESTNILNLDEFKMSFLKIERVFGEGSMSDLMLSEYASKSKKLKALSSLASNITPANLQVVKQTLSSVDDEIRMFGYAVINKAETVLNQKINKQLERIRKESIKYEEKDEAIIAHASKELAFLYWEMVYTELSHESLKNNFLNSVITYIELAKDYYLPKLEEIEVSFTRESHTDEIYKALSSLYMLMGRVYMKKNMYEQAKAEFTTAQEILPEKSTYILPYLAEVYYETGKYEIVQSVLSQAKGIDLNPILNPIMEQWKVS